MGSVSFRMAFVLFRMGSLSFRIGSVSFRMASVSFRMGSVSLRMVFLSFRMGSVPFRRGVFRKVCHLLALFFGNRSIHLHFRPVVFIPLQPDAFLFAQIQNQGQPRLPLYLVTAPGQYTIYRFFANQHPPHW